MQFNIVACSVQERLIDQSDASHPALRPCRQGSHIANDLVVQIAAP